MSIASVAAQQNTAATAASASAASPPAADSLGSLSSNFNNFLSMLMTQLKNQDPTSPMDTNQFTSELVQFSSVEQQINTNTSLTQLIQLTQAGEVMQASAMTGKQVTASSDHVPLQNGKGTIQFSTTTAQPVDIAIFDANGAKLSDSMLMSSAGTNTWTWNGTDSSGRTVPDGSYKFAVVGRWHNDGAGRQRDRQGDRCAESVQRHAAAIGRAVGRLLQGAVGGELSDQGPMRIDAGWPGTLNTCPVSTTLVPSTFRMEKVWSV
jgi:flagellar basal-body rod modification protein FlgD